jgi:hypothetical protein
VHIVGDGCAVPVPKSVPLNALKGKTRTRMSREGSSRVIMAVARIKTKTAIDNERGVGGRYLKIRHAEDPLHVSVAASFVVIGMQHE